ncbi:hypothetical protein EMB1_00001 [Bacteroides phage EMB1]|nr:hypothetical protein EMB1_00001 [Bacteroides phage EMB1]
MSCDFKPTVTTKALLAAVTSQPTDVETLVMFASPVEGDIVKLAISEAFKSFADTGLPKSARAGAPQGIAKDAPIFPIHAILFFPFFLVNYYPIAAA